MSLSFPCFQVLASPLWGKYGGLFRSTWCIKKVHCNLPSRIRISLIKGHESLANMELECGEYYLGRRDTSKFLFKLYAVINYVKLYVFISFMTFLSYFLMLLFGWCTIYQVNSKTHVTKNTTMILSPYTITPKTSHNRTRQWCIFWLGLSSIPSCSLTGPRAAFANLCKPV